MRRVIKFLTTSLFFAAFPIGISLLMRLINKAATPSSIYAPDILFMALMIGVTVSNDINEDVKEFSDNVLLQLTKTVLTLSIMLVAVLYGGYIQDSLSSLPNSPLRDVITNIAIVITAILTLISVAVELFIARIQAATQAVTKP